MADEADLLTRLRAGDEGAFVALVDRYHASMVRLASTFVPNRAVAEEVVQDTWLGMLRGLDTFEGRASLRTWLFRILINRARSTGVKEHRSVPVHWDEPAVDPSRFGPNGTWSDPPVPWTDEVDDRLAAAGSIEFVRRLIDDLPAPQRQVITLRDMEGLSSQEVCQLLEISEGNQRVLLHRARSRVRGMLSEEIGKG
ncbi:MAG: sigma-70 family RNA polymerase sigma factor [Actinomycetota bacterium]|nr:sigma-70 family RNA polymerase sigma factor [Actinomycetota bacterium]